MSIHLLRRQQIIHGNPDAVWKFFSTPANLARITPPYMNFTVTSEDVGEEIYPGQIITYKVSPLLHIPLFWMTEITHVQQGKMFVDEQRKGPYKLWHHQHHFEPTDKGVLMTDVVHYRLPLGLLGAVAHSVFVRRQLEDIFDYRHHAVLEIFPEV